MNASNIGGGMVDGVFSSCTDKTPVNNNWILENWFKTWPSREKSSSRDIIEVDPVSYLDLKNNINSVDAITYPDNSQDFILSTLKLKSSSEKNINFDLKMHEKTELKSMKYSPVDRMSLDALLETLPLVYNPSTRQLQVVKHKVSDCLINKSMSTEELKSGMNLLPDSPHDSAQMELRDNSFEETANLLPSFKESDESLIPSPLNSSPIIPANGTKKFKDSPNASFRLNPFHCKVDSSVPSLQTAQIGLFELDNQAAPVIALSRINTNTSLTCTDASSFSSITSSVTDASLHSTSDSAVCLTTDGGSINDVGLSKKKRGITDFLSRNVFSWRQKEEGVISVSLSKTDLDSISLSSVGNISQESNKESSWKIFSRRSLKAKSGNREKPVLSSRQAGTVGLIMESRPSSLPAKTTFEERKHKQEYEDMVLAAKKRELREECERQKTEATLQKQEEQLTASVNMWNDIIAKWKILHTQKKCRELWWNGVPSCVRGKVWSLVIGNELGISQNCYNSLVKRSREKLLHLNKESQIKGDCLSITQNESQESTMNLIQLDVARTFPQLCIFQKGGPYYDPLHTILCSYVSYSPSIGYVQGMSFLAATLLLNMEEHEAFIAFANLLTRQVHSVFFTVNQEKMSSYYATFESLLNENLPSLSAHLARLHVTPDMYFMDWILTVFSRSTPLDIAARIWDVYLRDGEEFLIRTALGILKNYSSELLLQECTAMTAQFLICLPEDLNVDELFKSISTIKTSNKQYSFSQILQSNIIKCSTITNV